jgi:hypothetical protein
MSTETTDKNAKSLLILVGVISAIGLAAMTGGIKFSTPPVAAGDIKSSIPPVAAGDIKSSTPPVAECIDRTNPLIKRMLEKEYTGELPTGRAEALCLQLREVYAREKEIERKRKEWRELNK